LWFPVTISLVSRLDERRFLARTDSKVEASKSEQKVCCVSWIGFFQNRILPEFCSKSWDGSKSDSLIRTEPGFAGFATDSKGAFGNSHFTAGGGFFRNRSSRCPSYRVSYIHIGAHNNHLETYQLWNLCVKLFASATLLEGWGLRNEIRVQGWGLRVEDRGLRVEGWGLRVEGWGLRVEGWGSRVEGWGLRVEGWGLRVKGFEFWV